LIYSGCRGVGRDLPCYQVETRAHVVWPWNPPLFLETLGFAAKILSPLRSPLRGYSVCSIAKPHLILIGKVISFFQ
jgi:hypothetical protein